MEVAIKMALRLWDVRVRTGKIENQAAIGDSEEAGDHMTNVIVLTQRDCYHGPFVLRRIHIIPFTSYYIIPSFS
jgi:hypothetical protein